MTVTAIARIFLALIMFVAAATKILSMSSFTDTLKGLGLKRFPRLLSVAVIVSEIFVSVALVSNSTLLVGQVLLYTLIAGFTWSTITAMRLQQTITCNCLGSLVPGTFGPGTLVRAGILFALNMLISLQPAVPLTAFELEELVGGVLVSTGILALNIFGSGLYEFRSALKAK